MLELFIADDAPRLGIDQKHASGLETALFQNALGLDVEDPDFGAHNDQVVLGDVVARRAQTIAVEHRAHPHPVGKCNGRRSVPGLHQAAMILIKRLFGRVHTLMVFPRLRNHHHHGMG